MLTSIRINSTIVDQIKKEQQQDSQYKLLKQKAVTKDIYWEVDDVRVLKYKGRLWVLDKLLKEFMKQAHESSYTMHSRAIKMYQDLKKNYWWNGMKKDVFDYVVKCLTYQQMKVEHQRPKGLC